MSGHFDQSVMAALKDAVVRVFWKRTDLRELFEICSVPQALVSAQDWTLVKIKIAAPVLDALNKNAEGLGPLRRILQETLSFKDGNHLLWCSDGQQLKARAEESLARLRALVSNHDEAVQTEQERSEAAERRRQAANKYRTFNDKLNLLKTEFIDLYQAADAHQRGYALERFLTELFGLFDLQPRTPFRRRGEQIDGAIALGQDHYLIEARWRKQTADLSDLRDLDGAVSSSLDNTLGLFISIEGFSAEAVQGYIAGNRPKLICMDGSDLFTVADARIELADLIQRKKDLAVQDRRIYVTAGEIVAGGL